MRILSHIEALVGLGLCSLERVKTGTTDFAIVSHNQGMFGLSEYNKQFRR
jgi:hypothetical protein